MLPSTLRKSVSNIRNAIFSWYVASAVVAGILVAGGIHFYELSSQVAQLSYEVTEANNRILSTRELIASLADGNEMLQALLVQEQQNREQTIEQVHAMAEGRELLLSQMETLESELSQQREQFASVDVSSVVHGWSTRVGRVECLFTLSGNRKARSVGSAVATMQQGALIFVTNKHVITGQSDLVPNSCSVTLPENGTIVMVKGTSATVSSEKDLGWLRPSLEDAAKLRVNTPLTQCTSKPAIGDALVILGYPSVGSTESITATEGIISGFDNGMYITSAKIEQGNSGGAAIHVKNNCFLGIPTLVVVGQIESLARILPL